MDIGVRHLTNPTKRAAAPCPISGSLSKLTHDHHVQHLVEVGVDRTAGCPVATEKDNSMNLSAPTMIVFVISLVIAALGILAALGIFSILPIASVWIVTIAYAVLLAGVLLKGV